MLLSMEIVIKIVRWIFIKWPLIILLFILLPWFLAIPLAFFVLVKL
jgi:hypothetical protein